MTREDNHPTQTSKMIDIDKGDYGIVYGFWKEIGETIIK